jgi:LmbE family N-acetylglucosaminyl deacetylase
MPRSRALIVVSPHLDDGVMSCGQFLSTRPGSVVITVFAGRPPDGRWGSWDDRCFELGEDPLTVRWAEDRLAVEEIGSTSLHLGFLDDQYGPPPAVGDITEALAEATSGIAAGSWLVPLGLRHPDHLLAHRASVALLTRQGQADWIVYEELPYRLQHPVEVRARLSEVQRAGVALGELQPPAVGKDRLLVFGEERYWRATALEH